MSNWTTERPTEPGYYWFWGLVYAWQRKGEECLFLAQVRPDWKGEPHYVIDCGSVKDPSGQWLPIPSPSAPGRTTPISSEVCPGREG